MFDNLTICPLTGVPTKGKATVAPLDGSKRALYTFKPIGQAVFERDHLLGIIKAIEGGNHTFRPDLAGYCREVAERGNAPVNVTYAMSREILFSAPKSFDEKSAHFLRMLYESGGKEHIKRRIVTFEDFPLAYASNPEEFHRILEALVDDGLLKYDNLSRVQGDWVDGIQAYYHNVLFTPNGKQAVSASRPLNLPDNPPSASSSHTLAHLHPTVQQAAGKLFADAHYPQAIQTACTSLEKAVQHKAGQSASVTGTALLGKAFPKDNPLITLSSDQGEREGYGFLYRGLLQAVRNHYSHNLTEIPAARALEWLGFISALFYKLDEAIPPSAEPSA
jgi:uncharacterized protein (TIGR02391 family)